LVFYIAAARSTCGSVSTLAVNTARPRAGSAIDEIVVEFADAVICCIVSAA